MRVLAAGVSSLVLSMGIARFAYTPLLPLMQQQAGLGIAEAATLASINYGGYLCGALIAAMISDLVLKDRLYRIGMLVAVASTAMMGLAGSDLLWAVSRFVAGLSSAAGLLLGSGLILNWLIRHDHHSELGIHFSGVGFGIALCAAAAIVMHPALPWDSQWLALAGLGCLLLWPALGWLPRPDRSAVTRTGRSMADNPPGRLFLGVLMLFYFCAGIGHVVTSTFIVAVIDRMPHLAGSGAWIFLVIGLAAAPSCMLWDLIARRTGEINALIAASLLNIAGILLPLLGGGLIPAMAGALLFGGTTMGIVSLVLTMAGKYYPTRPAKMMGKMTLAYGIAQIVGPEVTGRLAAVNGSYVGGLHLAAATMLAAALLLVCLKRIERRR